MKMRAFWLILILLSMVFMQENVWAQPNPGDTSISQAKVVYCGMKGLIEGNLGLVAGLIMAFLGVWGLIKGGNLTTGIVFIVAGASLTAIPGMVESTLEGFGALLKEAGYTTNTISTHEAGAPAWGLCDNYVPPQGFGDEKPLTPAQINERMGYCTGGNLDCL